MVDAIVAKCAELTRAECEHFLEKGFVVVKAAFPRAVADEVCETAWAALAEQGILRDNPETWKQAPYTRTQGTGKRFVLKEMAPRAWRAQLDVCGGADRLPHAGERLAFSDGAIGNLCAQWEAGYVPPSPELPGWVSQLARTCNTLPPAHVVCRSILTYKLWYCSTRMGGTSGTFSTAQSKVCW